ncbi:MAG: pyruvate kinase [Chloroflexi bacterium]|nr:pyruvate kinase [Chloroflexota bacterium]
MARNHALDLKRRTKTVCTIGPSTSSRDMLERLVKAGMNVARLNLSHGTEAEHTAYVTTIRDIARESGLPVAILIDIPGPKYRTGDVKSGMAALSKGASFVLTTRKVEGDDKEVSVNLPYLTKDVKPGDLVVIDDGAIKMKVQHVTDSDVECVVTVGGTLRPRRGLTVPGMRRSAPFLTEESMSALLFAIRQKPDFIALSFVSHASDIAKIRDVLRKEGVDVPLVSKIETRDAVANFDRVLAESDGIMVARGDMGVELPLWDVPLVQKKIIRECNMVGKPVITATQMLESMINAPSPTRAEVADVANAIFDGTDAVMLSAETSIGKYPLEALNMMVQIARQTDDALPYTRILAERGTVLESSTDDAISYNACHTAHQLDAKAIVAFTQSGVTARRVSRFRPGVPVLALTPVAEVQRRLSLSWGVHAFDVPAVKSVDEVFKLGRNIVRDSGLAKEGDLIVITAGIPMGVTGSTNLLKVERVT